MSDEHLAAPRGHANGELGADPKSRVTFQQEVHAKVVKAPKKPAPKAVEDVETK